MQLFTLLEQGHRGSRVRIVRAENQRSAEAFLDAEGFAKGRSQIIPLPIDGKEEVVFYADVSE